MKRLICALVCATVAVAGLAGCSGSSSAPAGTGAAPDAGAKAPVMPPKSKTAE